MNDKIFYNLSGKTLVSTPYVITKGIYHKSLIYMLSHTEEGAIGLMFNRLVNHIDLKSFFKIKNEILVSYFQFFICLSTQMC